MAKIILITHQMSGVGKSTLTFNGGKKGMTDYGIKVSKTMISYLVSFSRSVLVNGVEDNNIAQKQIDNLTKEILTLTINQ